MKQRRTLACKCGHVVGTWFDKRLNKDVCASCVELRRKAVKPWEADILISAIGDGWRAQVQRDEDATGPYIRALRTKKYMTARGALHAARGMMRRLGLVEKVKP